MMTNRRERIVVTALRGLIKSNGFKKIGVACDMHKNEIMNTRDVYAAR